MSERPNILLFAPDALRPEVLQPDHPCMAPNMQRVTDRGLHFSRAYTPNPTCSPARASLMTGLLPHNHGVLQVEHCVEDDQCVLRTDKPHWAQRLDEAGYQTGYFGKWHIERSHQLDRFGWQTYATKKSPDFIDMAKRLWRDPNEGLDPELTLRFQGAPGYHEHLYYGVSDIAPDERVETVPVNLAQAYLAGVLGRDEPWCCGVSFWAPNEALICSREVFAQYDVQALPLPENLRDELAGRPGFYRRQQRLFSQLTDDQWRMALACYYARVTEIDRQFGRLLDQIEAAGELENTLIVITTDHGRYLGGHGMGGHNFGPFEEIYRIPMILAGPGVAQGHTDARVGLHDLCPTILEYAGARVIDVPDSRSFAPVLADPQGMAGGYTKGYAENDGTRFLLTQRVCWDGPWKFAFNGFDEDELYNLDEDPHELTNRAQDPACADRVKAMQAQVWERACATHDKPLAEGHYYTMQFGSVGPMVAEDGH